MYESQSDRPAGGPGSQPVAGRYTTLQDYVRVIRRHRLLIALCTVGFAVLGLAIALVQSKTYEATAQLSFQDVLQEANLLGDNVVASEPPIVRASSNAQLVTRPEVTRTVKRKLKTGLSPAELESAVTTSVGATTNLVSVTAESSDANFAADLANAYAEQAKITGTKTELDTLKQAENGISDELKQAKSATPFSVARFQQLEQELSRVRTIRDIAQPVQIASRASAPTSPISPHPKRDTALGAMIGLVLGILAAFLRDALDRRVHNAGEVHDELGLPVLGRVSETALGFPGLARSGALPMADSDFEAFRALRMNLSMLGADRGVRSVLVTSALPEEGKSTVSMSLASAAAITGQRVLLVECDLRRPSFASRLGIPREPGLTDYLKGDAEPQGILRSVDLFHPTQPNGDVASDPRPLATLVCIAAGTPSDSPAELLLTERFIDFLDKVSKAYDLVVLDGSPFLAVVDALEIGARVDAMIVCVRARRTTREQMHAARAALEHLPERPMGAVVTGIRRGDPDSYDYYGY
jgi:polysaccharide biosynthesis transport protein